MKHNQTRPAFYLTPLIAFALNSCVVNDMGSTPGPASQVPGSRLSGGQSAAETVNPPAGDVPGRVIEDCLAELKKQVPDRAMKVIRARAGESSFIIDVEVEGVPQPWRCYHDGTSCTGTEYQGEG